MSGACSGLVLTLGMRSNSFSSARDWARRASIFFKTPSIIGFLLSGVRWRGRSTAHRPACPRRAGCARARRGRTSPLRPRPARPRRLSRFRSSGATAPGSPRPSSLGPRSFRCYTPCMLRAFIKHADGRVSRDTSPEALAAALRDPDSTFWLDMVTPTDEEYALLDEVFGFHPLAIEDTLNYMQ